MSDEFIKSIYVLMISLGLTRVEIDKELILKNDDPPLYVTYDNISKKYVFSCADTAKESDDGDRSGRSWETAKCEIDKLLSEKSTSFYLNRCFYKEWENEINSYLGIRGYQIVMKDYNYVYFEKMMPKKGWL